MLVRAVLNRNSDKLISVVSGTCSVNAIILALLTNPKNVSFHKSLEDIGFYNNFKDFSHFELFLDVESNKPEFEIFFKGKIATIELYTKTFEVKNN